MKDSESPDSLSTELVANNIANELENHKWTDAARDANNFHDSGV